MQEVWHCIKYCEELCGMCEEPLNGTEMGKEVCEMVRGTVSVNLEVFYVELYEILVTYKRNCKGLCEEVYRENCVEFYEELSEEPVGTVRNYEINCVAN